MQQYVYGTKICDIYDVQKCLTQTWVGFEWNVIEAAIDQWRDIIWDHVCVLVVDTEHILHICIIWFIRTFYETVSVIWCIWRIFCLLTLKAEFVFTCIFGVSTLTR